MDFSAQHLGFVFAAYATAAAAIIGLILVIVLRDHASRNRNERE